jgi:peroxiredoxin
VSSGKQWLVIGVIVAALGTALLVASRTIGAELFPLKIGSRAPDFSAVELATADAAPASTAPKGIDDYRGQVVLLNIWATWCAPCRVEMPSMQRLEEQLGPKGLRIVAVSIDDPGMEQRIRAFANELGLSFELLYDSAGEIQQQYQTTGVPETFIIGRDGRIRRRIIGADDWSSESNIAFLERLLDEPAS